MSSALRLALFVGLVGCDGGGSSSDAQPEAPAPDADGGKADSLDDTETCSTTLPPLVQLVNNSRAPNTEEPDPQPLADVVGSSAGEIEQALASYAEEIVFADYPFSGCHDRAHVTYLHLSRALGADHVAKVWTFSPRLMTVGLTGSIETSVDAARWGDATTRWDYHVAAVVRGPDGLLVVDPVLSDPKAPLSLEGWFGLMQVAPGSVYTLASGDRYSFNVAGPGDFSGGRMPFNGNLFAYEGFAKDDRWLEKDLARDAVAVAVADGSGCPDLRNNLLEPQVLYDELERMAADGATSDCMQYVDVYNLQLQAWTATVVSLLE